MTNTADRASGVPQAYGPYSHAVEAGGFVFVAGQIGRDSDTGKLIDGGIQEQTRRSLEIVSEILAIAGLTLDHVVRSTVYLADLSEFDAMNRVYETMFERPYPARSTPQVVLPFGARVGIEVTACRNVKSAILPE